MTEQEIESRILVCEMKESDYREVGNTKTADRYSNEKYKWEKLLDKLNPKRDEELADYKKGYSILEQALNEIKEIIIDDIQKCKYGQVPKYQEILEKIDKVLGEGKC